MYRHLGYLPADQGRSSQPRYGNAMPRHLEPAPHPYDAAPVGGMADRHRDVPRSAREDAERRAAYGLPRINGGQVVTITDDDIAEAEPARAALDADVDATMRPKSALEHHNAGEWTESGQRFPWEVVR